MQARTDTQADPRFPPPPVEPSDRMVPITTWHEMFIEAGVTGVEFDVFWYEAIEAGLAYFFRWLGVPRATVLVVWNDQGPMHIECRTFGDQPVVASDAAAIVAEVEAQFRAAGLARDHMTH